MVFKALGITTYSRLILLLKIFIEEKQQPNYIIQNPTTIPNKKYYAIKLFT